MKLYTYVFGMCFMAQALVYAAELPEAPTLLVDSSVGATANVVAYLVGGGPLWTWKNARQMGPKAKAEYDRQLRAGVKSAVSRMYRGWKEMCTGLGAAGAVQVATEGMLQEWMRKTTDKEKLSEHERMACSLGAGAASALVFNPLDNLSVKKQAYVGTGSYSTVATLRTMFAPGFFKGLRNVNHAFLPVVIRDGVWTLAWLEGCSVLKEKTGSQSLASLLAAAGLVAVTQPADEVNTVMKAEGTGLVETVVGMAKKGGVAAFYKGAKERYVLASFFIFVGNSLQNELKKVAYAERK